jgi:hypothetical protein
VDAVFLESGGFKETVSYIPIGQVSGQSIDAIVEDIQDPMGGREKGFDQDVLPSLVNACLIYVSEAVVSNAKYGDTYTQGTTVWQTRQITKAEGLLILYCIAEERMSR